MSRKTGYQASWRRSRYIPKHTSQHSAIHPALFVMISQSFKCLCQTATARSKNTLLDDFTSIRDKCPALREILVPDNVWEVFKKANIGEPDEAHHKSILLLALKDAYLAQLTSPIHCYLLEGEKPKKDLDPNYKEALKEDWLIKKEDAIKRHNMYKGYMGKFTEILCAGWLESSEGWKIDGLAALGAKADILATSPNGRGCAFEVKHIGLLKEDFQAIVNSMVDNVNGGARSTAPNQASDYLLLRAYEAACQFKDKNKSITNRHCTALVVFSPEQWRIYDVALEEPWIDWQNPQFFNKEPTSDFWRCLLKGRELKDIIQDLPVVLRFLQEVWVVHYSEHFEYSLAYVEKL